MSEITCPVPFLNQDNFPPSGGYIGGRICAAIAGLNDTACCVPCPLERLAYSDQFPSAISAAFWLSVPALILQVFLLLTYIVLPEKEGHRHYLNLGTVISIIILELCFIVSLAAKPDQCYNEITPHDMYSSAACAWTGALLLAGAMATIAWILVRSIYTHLRVVWNIDWRWFEHLSHVLGWGLPALFLAIALPVTGVSFQVTNICLPKQHNASATWFGWYITFSALATLLQLSTTMYCMGVFLASFQRGKQQSTSSAGSNTKPISGMYGDHNTWRRVRKVLLLQWRSIAVSIIIAAEAIFFGVVFVNAARIAQEQTASESQSLAAWALCLVLNNGDKQPCLQYASALGTGERGAVASVALVALTGVVQFLLMVRGSMFTGWYRLLRNPKKFLESRRRGADEFVFVPRNKDGPEAALADMPSRNYNSVEEHNLVGEGHSITGDDDGVSAHDGHDTRI